MPSDIRDSDDWHDNKDFTDKENENCINDRVFGFHILHPSQSHNALIDPSNTFKPVKDANESLLQKSG